MPSPKFVQRIARLPEVLTLLAGYPGGLPLQTVAERLDVEVNTLREDLVTYLDVESWGWQLDLFQRPAIEFVQPGSDEDSPDDRGAATVIRLVDEGRQGLLGAEYLSSGDLAVLYTAGMALLETDPDDEDLAGALELIAETMYGAPLSQPPAAGEWNRFVGPLREAEEQHRRVRITYSRSWRRGVSERVIEPLRLVQTRRGWEVDAGPVEYNGTLRTFLLSNIRTLEVLDETFKEPAGVDSLLQRQRRTERVRVDLAQEARWAVDMYAERHKVLEEDEETFTAEVDLLPPVTDRVALMMLASGPYARVDPHLVGGASQVIHALIAHHSEAPTVSQKTRTPDAVDRAL